MEEAFASTLVNGNRVRADLNHVGFWFADPSGDDVCFGTGQGAVTPFDGDNEAGVQVMNSANARHDGVRGQIGRASCRERVSSVV